MVQVGLLIVPPRNQPFAIDELLLHPKRGCDGGVGITFGQIFTIHYFAQRRGVMFVQHHAFYHIRVLGIPVVALHIHILNRDIRENRS